MHLKPFRFHWMLAILIALGALALAAEKLPQTPDQAPVLKLPAVDPAAFKVEVEAYRKIVTDLAGPEMEGRGPGTTGIDKARDYLVSEFKSLGLAPAFRSPGAGAGEASFTQAFEIGAGVRSKTQELVILDKAGKELQKPNVVDHFNARGFSGNGKFDGPVVFVGYGVVDKDSGYDSFAGSELPAGKEMLKGKVAVAFRYEPVDDKLTPTLVKDGKPGQVTEASNLMNKAAWAAEHGAAALIVVDGPTRDKGGRLPTVLETQSGAATKIPIIQVQSEVFRTMLRGAGLDSEATAKAWEKAANEGTLTPQVLKDVTVRGEVELTRAKATIHNVAGWLEGKGKLKDQVIVIGGHYDHLGHGGPGAIGKAAPDAIYHGADDNASGTTGVVLLARRFAAMAKDGGAADRRTLLFVCFSGEERGLLGSQHMLAHVGELGVKHEQMVAMFNFDMIGRMKDDKVIVSGTGSGDMFEKLMKDAAAAVANVKAVSGGAVGGSDHQSFQARKIPAVHFYTGVHPDYHRPSDTADKINHEGGVKTVELAARMILPLWESDAKVAWQTTRMAHPAAGGPTGSGAWLGVIPRYADLDANDGAAIDGASPGSPAEAAGLKSDDIIVGWNDKSVKNLQELTDRLRESKPGQEIALKVKRGGKDVVIKVKLGTR